MIKRLKYIFIPVLAILLMSHNVFAVDMSPNVHPIWANANPLCSFHNKASNTWGNNSFSNNSSGTTQATYSFDLVNCDYPQALNTVKTYAVYSFRFDNFAYDNSADSGWLASKVRSVSGSADWGIIGQTVSSMGSTGWQLDLYLYSTASSNGGTFQIYNPLNADEIFYLKPSERITFVGASYWQVTEDTDFEYNYTDLITAIYNNTTTSNDHLQGIRNNTNGSRLALIEIRSVVRDQILPLLNDMSQNTADAINDGQAEATQDASDDSSTAGSSSSSDATSATSSLLSVIGAGIGAITTATPTNCKINGDMGNLDIGNIDLCANPVPAFIAVIGSIIAVLVVLPLVIVLFNRFISIIRSFQG